MAKRKPLKPSKVRLSSPAAVAQLYGVTKNAVRGWCARGVVLAIKTPGGEWRLEVDDQGVPLEPEK